jgi:hypothetical protein
MLSRAVLKRLKCRATAVSRPQYFATRQTVRQKVLLPLWGKLGSGGASTRLPLCPDERTSPTKPAMLVSCQEQTSTTLSDHAVATRAHTLVR